MTSLNVEFSMMKSIAEVAGVKSFVIVVHNRVASRDSPNIFRFINL